MEDPTMPNGFTVCVLLFGDHIDLAKRCLGSICNNIDPALVHSLRVGMNACSDRVRKYVWPRLCDCPADTMVYDCGAENRLKYPVMRKMFYDDKHPITTQYLMWFDDDSCLAPGTESDWWAHVHVALQRADMIGQMWTKAAEGDQIRGISRQPWFKGVPLRPGHRFKFATGGWWAARTRVIQQLNYPWVELIHNGGDTTLGEAMRQQGLRLAAFDQGLWINADAQGQKSKAPRRGESRKPVWYHYDPHTPLDNSHHRFVVDAVDPKVQMMIDGLAGKPIPPDTRLDMRGLRPKGGPIRIPGL